MDWTPLDVRPLHAGEAPEQRWACMHPQVPAERTVFDLRCRSCCDREAAHLAAHPRDGYGLALLGPLDAPRKRIINRRRALTAALRELHGVDV